MTDRAIAALEMAPLCAVMALAGPHAELLEHSCVAIGDGTFTDRQHEIAVRFAGDAVLADGIAFLQALRVHEFEMPGLMVECIRLVRSRFSARAGLSLLLVVQLDVRALHPSVMAVAA